eukprot:5362707-Pyramimonas_sp.AAC.1
MAAATATGALIAAPRVAPPSRLSPAACRLPLAFRQKDRQLSCPRQCKLRRNPPPSVAPLTVPHSVWPPSWRTPSR